MQLRPTYGPKSEFEYGGGRHIEYFYSAMHYSASSISSVCQSVCCDDGGSGSHTLEMLETNCTDNRLPLGLQTVVPRGQVLRCSPLVLGLAIAEMKSPLHDIVPWDF